MSEHSPEVLDSQSDQIFNAADLECMQTSKVEVESLRQLLETEKALATELRQELNLATQGKLKAEDDVKYWRDKCVRLQMDLGSANYDLSVLRGERQGLDSTETLKLKTQMSELEDKFKHMIEAHKHEMEAKEQEMQDSLKQKDDIIQRIRDVVDRLNIRLDEQKTESKIIENILALPDGNSMMRAVYTAQFKVNQKIISNIAKAKRGDEKASDSSSSTGSEDLTPTNGMAVPQQPFMVPQMMFPHSPMHFGPIPVTQPTMQSSEQATSKEVKPKEVERED